MSIDWWTGLQKQKPFIPAAEYEQWFIDNVISRAMEEGTMHPTQLPGDDYKGAPEVVKVGSNDFREWIESKPEGKKHDRGKVRLDLVDPHWLESVARVLTHGAEKYAEDNWKRVDKAEQRYLAAALRHLNAYQKGETFDEESGLPHTSHAACCLMFLFYLNHEKDAPF